MNTAIETPVHVEPVQFQEALSSQADNLVQSCSKVSVRISWFTTSSKVQDDQALDMVKTVGAERSGVSISKRLMASQHKSVKLCNEAKRMITDYLRSMTLPMIALTGDEDEIRKDAGVRLIQKKDMADFDARIQELKAALMTAVQKLQDDLPAVRAEDQKRLGALYRESDYPEDVTKMVGVEVHYESTAVDLDWATLCPEIYDRERQAARKTMEKVVETAAQEFSASLLEAVQLVTRQLGSYKRINPGRTHALAHLKDAEIVSELTHQDDPESIPAGRVSVELAYAEGKKNVRKWYDLTLAEYQALNPYDTGKTKRLYASSLEHLKTSIETFRAIGSMMGPYENLIRKSVDDVQNILVRAAGDLDPEKIAKQAKSSAYFRRDLQQTLAKVSDSIQQATGVSAKQRRRLDMSLAGKLDV